MGQTTGEKLLSALSQEVVNTRNHEFGQLGSAFNDSGDAITPPAGKVIVAISFLGTMSLTGLVAENVAGSKSFAITAGQTGEGSGGEVVATANKFPSGATICGRWTSVTCSAQATGGIIAYFGY
jgi:hypothetical protein